MSSDPSRLLPAYAELHCRSNFTFLHGASHPEELIERAAALGYSALALTDECSFAGVVRAHTAARRCALPLIIGSEVCLDDGTTLVLLAPDRRAYGAIAALITAGRRRAPKGEYRLSQGDLVLLEGSGALVLLVPHATVQLDSVRRIALQFPGAAWLAVELHCGPDDRAKLADLRALAMAARMPLVAAGGVRMHVRSRRRLADTLTAIRLGKPVSGCGHALASNAERHLRLRMRLAQLYPAELLAETLVIADRCHFSLDTLRYEYPEELVPAGETPDACLRRLTEAGLAWRFPGGVPEAVRATVEHELTLISALRYEAFFLTVHDLVHFARGRGILCQGRGSAANSAVCYALGITEVDPGRMTMLFERFISRERNEPPDIDVDFEHQRREEVIQYVYAKYGRERAALAATVICYRPKSAVRDVGRALGLSERQVERLSKGLAWWDDRSRLPAQVRETGLDPESPVIARLLELTATLIGFPRHLSQHVGGFIISRGPLHELVPVENAAMPERTVIQWDKDDLEALGLLKVDVLALGMLSAIRRALELAGARRGTPLSIVDIPAEDPATYAMICRADTVGVFQIESRAQMSMLPRLRPANFYDLVIEVAIVRPGPIQGGMVHPYLRRRQGLEPVRYPSDAVRQVLERTLGVPIFQEQVMQLAVVAAGFTPGDADNLRRSMAAWKRRGGLEHFEARLVNGMLARGYRREFAEGIYRQILGFGEYGFPESHSASFALLVYVSAWLKCHEPAAFLTALLNSQPMGFYAPAQLVQDARRHGVEVRPPEVTASVWDCTLEGDAVRLGLRMIGGLGEAAAERIVEARRQNAFDTVEALAQRARLEPRTLRCLAAGGALAGLAGHRRQAHWQVAGVAPAAGLLQAVPSREAPLALPAPAEGDEIVADYASLGLTLGRHPLALLRTQGGLPGTVTAAALQTLQRGRAATVAGLVTCRQRPDTASGVVFVTLEDETGSINVIVWRSVFDPDPRTPAAEGRRRALLGARLLAVRGVVEREGEVVHLVARHLVDRSELLGCLSPGSRDFH